MSFKIKLYDTDYDCIGEGCMSLDFINYQLAQANGDDVEVDISSGGGSHFQAVAIYHELKKYGNVDTNNISIAGSAASTVFAAGKKRTMSKYALLMIHPATRVTEGDSRMLTSDADLLSKCTENVKQIWVTVTGQPYDVISKLVDATTWLDADTALQLGFITDIEEYSEDVSNASVILNQIESAPLNYKQVINKILIKNNNMTDQEIKDLVNGNKSVVDKVLNFLKLQTNKMVTNKGDRFYVGNLSAGTTVYNSDDLEEVSNDEDEVEMTTTSGKKVKMKFKDGKVSNIEAEKDEDDKDEEDEELDAENKAVLNSYNIGFKKKTGANKILNQTAKQLATITNSFNVQNQIVADLRKQLEESNKGLLKREEDIRNEIKSTFEPPAGSRSNKGEKEVKNSFAPKSEMAQNAVKDALAKAKQQ